MTRTTFLLIAALTALLIATAILVALPAGAQTAPAIDSLPGITCQSETVPGAKRKNGRRRPATTVDMCRVPLGLGDEVVAPREDFFPSLDGLGFEVHSGDKQLTVRLCADRLFEDSGLPCFETFRGTKRAVWPQLGFLQEIVTLDPPVSTVGLDTGANLLADDLELPELLHEILRDDERYLIYHTEAAGMEGVIPGVPDVGLSAGGATTTLVRTYTQNPLEGLLFYEGQLKGIPFSKKSDAKKARRNKHAKNKNGRGEQKNVKKRGKKGKKKQQPESRAQIAYSADPRLPFEPIRTKGVEGHLQGFDGHLYLRGQIPMYKLITLDGTVVANLDPDQDGDHPFEAAFYTSFDVELGGNGAAFVKLPFFTLPNVGLDLGEASVGVRISEDRDDASITGIVTSEDFLSGLPIPIRRDQTIEAWGRISADDLAGSYLHLEGSMSVDAAGLGQLLGLPLGDLLSDDAVMDINAGGLTLQGTTTRQIHPDIFYSRAVLIVHISPDGRDSYIELQGKMTIAGEGLDDARVRVSRHGMFVNGKWLAGSTEFPMTGRFGRRGYELTGAAVLADPIELNAQKSVALGDEILQNETLRGALEAQLAAALRDVADAQDAFEDAKKDVDDAQAEVDKIDVAIRSKQGSRDSAYSSYSSWKKKSCKIYQASCIATRSAKISYYYGRYAFYVSEIKALELSRKAATGVLGAAQQALSPFEVTLRNTESLLAKIQSQLDELAAAIHAAREQLDALPSIDGSLDARATATIANGAVSVGASARWNGRKLLRGTVKLADPGEACFDIPRASTVCSPL